MLLDRRCPAEPKSCTENPQEREDVTRLGTKSEKVEEKNKPNQDACTQPALRMVVKHLKGFRQRLFKAHLAISMLRMGMKWRFGEFGNVSDKTGWLTLRRNFTVKKENCWKTCRLRQKQTPSI